MTDPSRAEPATISQALSRKAVVITGAGRGIGAATARYLAALGANVIVNDIDASPASSVVDEIRVAGGNAEVDTSDIRSSKEAANLIDHCVEVFGRIDGLVNNAGLFHIDRLEDTDPNAFVDLMMVNVLGTFNCAQHAIRRMYAQGRGSIVNITSGAQAGIPMMTSYSASKGAVSSMTYTWALEAATTGVRINAVSPVATTRMSEVQARRTQRSPGAGTPPEVNAPLIAFLLSDRSKGINGQVIRFVNDSLSIMSHPAICAPVFQSPRWTLESIADVFEHDLERHLQPVGLSTLSVSPALPEDVKLPWPPSDAALGH